MGVDVIVVGAGPTGLMLAHELALGGAQVTVLEQATERVQQTKGGAIQPRTAELLDARGLLDPLKDRMLARPPVGGHFAGLPVELDCTPWRTRQPYPLSVAQWTIEEVFETAATALGAQVLRGRRVAAVEVDDVGVLVTADVAGTADTAQFRARYVVACDGAHSTVRKVLGLPFPGRPGTYRAVLADIRLSAVSDLVPASSGHMSTLTRSTRDYWGMLVPIGGDRYRFTYGKIGASDAPGDPDDATGPAPVSAEAVQHALTDLYGAPTALGQIVTGSRFTDATRQLEHYRPDIGRGRILFAGDAAHIHAPLGGQGLNLGVQDAINLGWKLAATITGWAPDRLLDSYHEERHPVAARVLHHTSAQRVLADPRPQPDVLALREIFTGLMRLPDANRHLAGMMSGLDDPARFPDLDLTTGDGPTRPAWLLRSGHGVLLDQTGSVRLPPGWADRVDLVRVKGATGPDGLDSDAAFEAVLIRPDGAVCWRAESGTPLEDALRTAFGAPAAVGAVAAHDRVPVR